MREKIEKLNLLNRKTGVWSYLFGSLLFYFSVHYAGSFWGLFFLILGAVLALSDPLIFLLKPGPKKDDSRILYTAWIFGSAALLFFFARFFFDSSLPIEKLGKAENTFIGKLRTLFLFLFVLCYAASVLCRFLLSLSYGPIASITASFAKQRQKYFRKSLISILSVFLFVILANYLSYLRNPSLDLSPGFYSFGEGSRSVIRSIDREAVVYAFLPELQAVKLRRSGFTSSGLYKIAPDVRLLLEQIHSINSKISVEFYNADLEAYDINEFGNVSNGTVIVRSIKKETHSLSREDKPYVERKLYVNSRKDLNTLERNITKALVYTASPKRIMYFTSSNGERYNAFGPKSRTIGIESLKEQLRFYNMALKSLDQKSDWPGKPVPKDADALLVIGPTIPFGKEAQEAVSTYLKKGGALFLTIDPQKGSEDFSWLLKKMGGKNYNINRSILTNTNFSGVLISDNFSSHNVVESIKTQSSSIVLLPQQAYFASGPPSKDAPSPRLPKKSKDTKKQSSEKQNKAKQDSEKQKKQNKKKSLFKKQPVKNLYELEPSILLHSPYNSYVDSNRNGRKDSQESSGRKALALAYEKEGMPGSPRVVIFSGTDWLSERGIRFPIAHHNLLLAADSLFWLVESPLTAAFTPIARPERSIQVTEGLKWKLFAVGMVVFPILTGLGLGLGIFLYRRRRNRKHFPSDA